ncbi:MAG: DUF554 domain-containing protein [Peptostreptococcaceae bacterium]|nr:DUF554 domain-containing protein [Peptostreptococcaceae bacterium]
MLGTLVNAAGIIIGSTIGLLFGKRITERYNQTIIKSIALAIILMGIQNALKVQSVPFVIISLFLGSFLGEYWDIEGRLEKLGLWMEKKMAGGGNSFSKGFVTATLLHCVGSMAIIGALEGGLTGNHQILYAKSVINGVIDIVLASTLGIGVLFSSVSVLLYQGSIVIAASFLKQFLVESVVTEMSAIGGLLIMAMGLNMLDFKKIRVGNMIPAIFMPLIYFVVKSGLY